MPSARVTCPYCNAKLRLSTAGGAPSRAKCRTCGKTFTPTYTGAVEGAALYLDPTASAAPLLNTPLVRPSAVPRLEPIAPLPPPPAAAEPPRLYAPPPAEAFPSSISFGAAVMVPPVPAEYPAAEPVARRAAPPTLPPAEVQPPPPQSVAAVIAPPVEVRPPVALTTPPPPRIDQRPPDSPRREPPPVAPLLEPPPPVAEPINRERHWERLEAQRAGGLRPFEIALALALVLSVLGGLGTFWYLKTHPTKTPPAVNADDADDTAAAPMAGDVPAVELGPKPRPPELEGTWELRSDDGRSGRLVLCPDGRLIAASSAEDSPLQDYTGQWFLSEAAGNRYVLDFGREYQGLDGYKVTIVLTCPDAFTLVQTVMNGVPISGSHRFVRTGPASGVGAKGPTAARPEPPAPGGDR